MPLEHSRRTALRFALAAGASLAVPLARPAVAAPDRRALAMHNLHTGESLETVYWSSGTYVSDGLAEIDHLLRDHRAEEVGHMDPQLLDQLHALHRRTRSKRELHIISGYRSPATNAKLRANSNGVAKRSLHMQGRAIDIRLPGFDTAELRRVALEMKAGGVGYYRKSDFIHVDTGRVRFW